MDKRISAEVQDVVMDLADMLEPYIKELHSTPPKTPDYFGDYVSLLAMMRSGDHRLLVAAALRLAGAKIEGLRKAASLVCV